MGYRRTRSWSRAFARWAALAALPISPEVAAGAPGVPVTLFVFPSAIGNAAYALTWGQLAETKRSGLVDVPSHTYWHPNVDVERRRMDAATGDARTCRPRPRPASRSWTSTGTGFRTSSLTIPSRTAIPRWAAPSTGGREGFSLDRRSRLPTIGTAHGNGITPGEVCERRPEYAQVAPEVELTPGTREVTLLMRCARGRDNSVSRLGRGA